MTRRDTSPYYKQNRLQQLRGFCHAVRAGSISKAADAMALSQPSVSLQIQSLEREFNTTLFERRGPKMVLTPDGQALYNLASPLVESLETLQETFVARRDEVETGRLDVAAGESTILYLLPKFVRAFAKAYPRIELTLHNVTGLTGLAMLREGEVDLAVGSMIDVPDDITYRPLFTYDPMLITARNHPLSEKNKITIRDISLHPLILPPRHLSTWRIVDAVFKRHNLPYEVRVQVGGWEVIKKYVELGLGVSVVTSICLSGSDRLAAMPVTRYFPKRTYGVVLRNGRFLSPQARRFVDMIIPSEKAAAPSA